jgi:Na+-driven multidrug efflux pump
MELQGAAIGTIFANILAMIAGLYLMHKRGMIDFSHVKNLSLIRDSARRLLMIALPAGITSMLPSVLNSVVNHLLSKEGPEAVAAFGAASRIEAFTLVILMALSIGMAPIIGQNWGARKMDRVKETVKTALVFCVAWSVLMAAILSIFATPLSEVFSKDVAVQHYLALYFLIVPPTYFLGNLSNGWGSTFNAIGKPQISASMLFIKMIILTIPAAIIGYHLNGAVGVFIGIAIINCFAGLAYHLWAWDGLGRRWAPTPRH